MCTSIQIIETAVFGAKDHTLGEKVIAVVVCRDSSTTGTLPIQHTLHTPHDTTLTAAVIADGHGTGKGESRVRAKREELIRVHLKDRLAIYKQPREYIFLDAIPRNHLGKVRIYLILSHIIL